MPDKQWNEVARNWEIDGIPVTYRVSWKQTSDGSEHSREFLDLDQGYSFFQDMKKGAGAYAVMWDHVPW